MKPPLEQIKAILGPNFGRWVSDQLQPNQSMADRRYEDFVTVTPADVEQYVLEHGLAGADHIYEQDDPSLWKRHTAPEGWYLVKNDQKWEVFWKERLAPLGVESFPTREAAVHHLVGEMMRAIKTWLDLECRDARQYSAPLDPPVEGAGLPYPPTVPQRRGKP